jgi:4-hydroxy-tetrahydrodipicolinate reductase
MQSVTTKIFVVGSGTLANAILASDLPIRSGEVLKWESQYQTINGRAIVIHAGSGRQLKECFEFCERTRSVFIELSTGLDTETMEPSFPLVICPNTSILVLKTLRMVQLAGGCFENYGISITESHQSTKKTEPGTAYAFANSLSFPHDEIISVRDPVVQQNSVGIPPEYLSRHAYHKIVISDGADEVTIQTKVLGHDSYAHGVRTIVEAVLKHGLENRKYTVLDLVEGDLL